MADICRSCALRAQRSASSALRHRSTTSNVQRRTFTATSTQQKRVGPPVFSETTDATLDSTLLALRENHIIPAYLSPRQRHLIFGDKFITELENNPAYATLGSEEIPLKHIDRRRDMPARRPLVRQALALMREPEHWKHLPSLLEGLYKGQEAGLASASSEDMALREKMLRKAIEADQLGVVVRCLNRSAVTGITLKDDNVLALVMWGLRSYAQPDAWQDEERLRRALRYSHEIAQLLESEQHGSASRISKNDPRTRPAVIAVYLELVSVLAQKHHAGKDADGHVKKYAERLMACFDHAKQLPTQPLNPRGPCNEFLTKLPIYHGLYLATRILGSEMPQASKAASIVSDYESRLSDLARNIEAQAKGRAATSGYAGQALSAWQSVIRA